MSDSSTTVRPSADAALGGWALTGGATAHAVLSDDSDSSYAAAAASAGAALKVGITGATLGGGDQLRYVQPWIRAATPDSVARVVAVRLYGIGAHRRGPEQFITMTGTPTRYTMSPLRAWGNGQAFTADDLLNLFLAFRESSTPVGALRLYEAGIDLIFNAAPTISLTATADPITTTSVVTGSWAFSDAEAETQQAYQERLYERPGLAWPETSTPDAEVAALEANEIVPLNDVTVLSDGTTSDPFLLPPTGVFRRYVRVRDTSPGGTFGPWSGQEWSMSVVGAPAAPRVTATAQPTLARIAVTVEPNVASPLDFMDVERSFDGGSTWESLTGDPALHFDYHPAGPNVLNDGAFAGDTDGNGFADGWSAYSTGGGDPAPTGTISVGGGQQVAWTTNTGNKGLLTRPRVGSDGSNIWPANSEWLLSFDYSSDRANADMLPVLGFTAGGFTVVWVRQPSVGTAPQGFLAKITAPGSDTEADLRIYSTGPSSHHFNIASASLSRGGSSPDDGYAAARYAAASYAGTEGGTVSGSVAPPFRAREDTTILVGDRNVLRRIAVLYRARTAAFEGSGALWETITKASPWATSGEVTLDSDGNAWLQPAGSPVLDMAVCLVGPDLSATSREDQAAFYAEGRAEAVVVSGTRHAEALDAVNIVLGNDAERDTFEAIRALEGPVLLRTLYGQDPMEQFWIRIGADVNNRRLGGYGDTEMEQAQLRSVTFVAYPVKRPAGAVFAGFGSAGGSEGGDTWETILGTWSDQIAIWETV